MKNKIIYALGAIMLVGVTSCDLTEKPSSFYEKDTYFVTEGKARMAVVGINDCIGTMDYYGQNIMPFFGSDDMFMVRGTGSDGTRREGRRAESCDYEAHAGKCHLCESLCRKGR